MEHPCPQSEADLEMQDCAQQHVVSQCWDGCGFYGHGLPTERPDLSGGAVLHPKADGQDLLAPRAVANAVGSSPHRMAHRHCGCASEQVDVSRGTTCSSCTLFARSTRSSRLQRGTPSTISRKPASCRLAVDYGADVSNSNSLPVNILNLAEKILGPLTMTRRWRCSAFK